MFENLEKELRNITIKKQQENILQKYRLKNQDFVYSEIETLWQYIKDNSKQFNNFNHFDEILEDYELKELKELRLTYPELSKINDFILYGLYDDYQRKCNEVSGWDIYREEAFLFYLICQLTNFEVQDPNDLVFGEIVAHFLLQDKSLESAKNLAMQIKEIYSSHKVYFY